MSYKKNNFITILMAVSLIALVTTASFNHSYTAFAAPKKTGSKGSSSDSSSTGNNNNNNGDNPTSSSSSSAAATPNSNALTKKELSSFIDCIRTANGSQGLTHKVVTNCLDTAKGTTSATIGGGANGAGSSIGSSSSETS
jgi:hypothetical protein